MEKEDLTKRKTEGWRRGDFHRPGKFWCKTHRRFFPSDSTACLLCALERLEKAETGLAKSA